MLSKSAIQVTMISLCFLLSLVHNGCRDVDDVQIQDVDARTITFSVKVPGSATPKTYALNESDENQVNSIEILLFDTNGDYTYQPIYSNTIDTDPGDSRIKTFTVKVPEGTYNMVILANARLAVSNNLSSFNEGDSKASVLEKLLFTNTGKWIANPAAEGYRLIPMFGEIPSITVNSSTSLSSSVTMVRMISKIDVALTHANATNNFKLEDIRLYNYNDKGYIAPIAANWNQAQSIVTEASVPPSSNLTLGPLLYSGTAITTTDISSIGEIYTFESTKGIPPSLANATCLVIGGTYTGDSQPTYYRIDFAQTSSSTTTYLSLLRNHHYKVNITEISGPGQPTPTDAFNSRPVNIKAEIIEWNDAQIPNVVFDGQYMLGVSVGEFTLPRDEHTSSSEGNSIAITTDYPTGWNVDKIVDTGGAGISWLSLVSTTGTPISSGAANTTTNAKLKLLENTSGVTRIGFIHLKAGRLDYVVKVTQGTNAGISLSINNSAGSKKITELVFSAAIGVQPDAQQFRLKWTPVSASVSATNYIIGSLGLSLDAAYDRPGISAQSSISDPSGNKLLSIRPTAIVSSDLTTDPFLVKISKMDFTVFNGTSYLTESLFLRQFTYNVVFSNVISSYWTNGSTYTFNVRSNANWRIKSVTENRTVGSGSLLDIQLLDNLKVGTTGSPDTGSGTAISFKVASNILSLAGQVTVVFESPDSPKKFDDVSLVLNLSNEYYPAAHKGWAGSNIYWDGSKLTFDDVNITTHKNYQGLYFQGGSLYGISPVGAYADTTKVYPPNGGITTVHAAGMSSWVNVLRPANTVISNPPSGKTEKDRAFLYEITDATNGVGDICRHLTEKGWAPGSPTKKWRMPTSQEFYEASSYTIVGSPFTGITSTKHDGSDLFNKGYNKTGIGSPFFPAGGYRDYSGGGLTQIGTNGAYWTSSATSTNSYYLVFGQNNSINLDPGTVRQLGFTIRCVAE
ncbi:MAG: fimbrial protein [Dysgonomonas sp.]